MMTISRSDLRSDAVRLLVRLFVRASSFSLLATITFLLAFEFLDDRVQRVETFMLSCTVDAPAVRRHECDGELCATFFAIDSRDPRAESVDDGRRDREPEAGSVSARLGRDEGSNRSAKFSEGEVRGTRRIPKFQNRSIFDGRAFRLRVALSRNGALHA
ncbi:MULTISPECIES: hypothetical protein [Caballeronia]|uniref:hypothetical protein n=1 Tax=Caballeronia TaxID=1827195 RepID=UPI00158CCE0D|nr:MULTISPECIES: hypothetical protein [Caballeronia]MCG7403137.1 hypothetical protein [Caballeronia zhejiangensis]MCI1043960.1 hypothetical protein [Caballeronia zhejiangensis]